MQAGKALAAACQPAGPMAAAVILDSLLAFARGFNIPVPDAKAVTDAYLDGLADLPADLLQQAVRHARGNWKWGNRLPTPAEVKEPIAEELSRRTRELAQARIAVRKLPKETFRDRTNPADQAAAAEAFAAMRAKLAEAPPMQRVELRPDDGKEPDDPREALRRGREALATFRKVAKDPAA